MLLTISNPYSFGYREGLQGRNVRKELISTHTQVWCEKYIDGVLKGYRERKLIRALEWKER